MMGKKQKSLLVIGSYLRTVCLSDFEQNVDCRMARVWLGSVYLFTLNSQEILAGFQMGNK